jgi:hypothetical protein
MKYWKKLAFAVGLLVAGWMVRRRRFSDPLLRLRTAGM